jgi:hypothetical protein
LVDSQEYKDILNNITAGDNTTDTLSEVLSTYNKYIEVNDAIVARAETDVPASGYDTSGIYTLSTTEDGRPGAEGVDTTSGGNIASGNVNSSSATVTSTRKVEGYLTGDALPPNGASVAAGVTFPYGPTVGDYYLRLDYKPNRLFRYDGRRWVKMEDGVRTNLTPGATDNLTQRSQFINDENKFMSNIVIWDAIRVASPYTPAANAATLSFTLSTKTVVTKTPYVSTHGIKTYLNGQKITNTKANTLGNISFTVSSTLALNDVLEYTVYRHVINERQGLSQILRPEADNL